MQLRISNAIPQAPSQNSIPHHIRRNKAIFTYHNKQLAPRNIYYDTNPYFLHFAPSEQRMRPFISTSRNSNHSRQHSQNSSQRSMKVIRANGLRLVEKPKIVKIAQHHSVNDLKLNDPTRKFVQREMELESQNRMIKGENEYLKQKLRILQQSKDTQIQALQQKIEHLMSLTGQIEAKMISAQNEWKQQIRKLKDTQNNY